MRKADPVPVAYQKANPQNSILRTDAFSGIRSSFIGQLMEPSYDKCRGEGGQFTV